MKMSNYSGFESTTNLLKFELIKCPHIHKKLFSNLFISLGKQ